MEKTPITVPELALQPFTAFEPNGILLVSGESVELANVMTISWGMFGIMWGRPVVMVMVRPTRYTWEFITRTPDFTVNWMHEEWADAVGICGQTSGRDSNKFEATGLTPIAGQAVKSPILEQSELSLECRILYRSDVNPQQFYDQSLLYLYEANDYHGLFFGEIVAAAGVDRFRLG